MTRCRRTIAILLALLVNASGIARGEGPPAKDIAFFETKIRPVLVQHCYECHAANSAELGGKLRLDSRTGMRAGGESGPAIVDGDPDSSLIVQALRYDGIEMPPEQPLPEAVVNDFVKWVRLGAPDPRIDKAAAKPQPADGSPSSELWSLQPIADPPVPGVAQSEWARDPLDHFVLARLEAKGLRPAGDAEPRDLIRRLYYDLIGLPPMADEVERFVAAHQKNAISATEHVVDELLNRPQFGERWGRHWLDVARYGESNGNDGLGRNPTFPHAWRYRDYVIAAWNADTPYDEFLTEQIAGDLLASDSPELRDRRLVATGFLALASKPAKAMNNNFAMDVVADQIDVVGRGIMGLSVGCARCHDHKFDPIPTSDYYALAGIFTSTETMWGAAGYEKLTAPVTDLHVLKTAAKAPPPKGFEETVINVDSNTGKPKPVPKSKWPPGTPLAMGVRDAAKPADCKVNIKGDAKKLGGSVPRGFLSACHDAMPDTPDVNAKQSGRLELARWLTDLDHPLTARVIVNRLWLHLFGAGIVGTPDDFGTYGQRPTHPLLLDHLATRLVHDDWSLKRTIRAIVLSRTYQLSCLPNADIISADPEKRLLSYHARRRLDAESIRDSMLQASGQLDLSPGEGSLIRHRNILVNIAGNLHEPSNHRSIYLCYLRGSPPPALAPFDLPDFTQVQGRRDVSTVPGQALHLLNSPFVATQAEHFAGATIAHSNEAQARVDFVYRRALQRAPQQAEQQQALALVHQATAELDSELLGWASLCQALLASNEFRYID